MNLPNDANSNNPQTQFGAPITPSNMWIQLLAFHYAGQPAYLKTDQAFIDEWNNAIDMYGQIFSGITLVVTTGNGLPNFTGATVTIPPRVCGRLRRQSEPGLRRGDDDSAVLHAADRGRSQCEGDADSGMEAARVDETIWACPA